MRINVILSGFLAALLVLPAVQPAQGGDRDGGLRDRPAIGEPVRFRDTNGGAFRPKELLIVTDRGTFVGVLPATADARSENRVNLTDVPLVGDVFEDTLAPDDARQGVVVGPVFKLGDRLVIDAAGFPDGLQRAPVVLSTVIPRLGAVTYRLGRPAYRTGQAVSGGEPIGSAHILDGSLVIVSAGGEPAYPSADALFRDLFE